MKQVLSFLLSIMLMVGISTSAFAAGNTYHDVPASHWAYQYIESVTEKGLFGGVGAGNAGPFLLRMERGEAAGGGLLRRQ